MAARIVNNTVVGSINYVDIEGNEVEFQINPSQLYSFEMSDGSKVTATIKSYNREKNSFTPGLRVYERYMRPVEWDSLHEVDLTNIVRISNAFAVFTPDKRTVVETMRDCNLTRNDTITFGFEDESGSTKSYVTDVAYGELIGITTTIRSQSGTGHRIFFGTIKEYNPDTDELIIERYWTSGENFGVKNATLKLSLITGIFKRKLEISDRIVTKRK